MKLEGRDWNCVLAAADGPTVMEQWCPRGEMPTRASALLTRTRWRGKLGAPPAQFVQLVGATAAEGSPVRPTLRMFPVEDRTAVALLTFEGDVLMGDHWQLHLVHAGRKVSVDCIVEADGPPPTSVEPVARLAAALVHAPDGVPAYAGPPADQVQAAASRLELHVAEDTIDADLEAVDRVVRAAEALPPSPAANACLAQLATRLAGAPGAGFFGFAAESLRLFRILLRRTNRRDDAVDWALYARGALLARAQLSARRDLAKLVAACEGALEASLVESDDGKVASLEQAVLWHTAGELLVRTGNLTAAAGDRAPYERAVTACTRSHEAARALGTGFELFAYAALECRARAQRGLNSAEGERATLTEALELAPATERNRIEVRLRELAASRHVPPAPASDVALTVRVEQLAGTHHRSGLRQLGDRVIHSSPLRPASTYDTILVLRPLVTAFEPTVPNRFVAPFRHAWRFQDEPSTMTFEETLSRALGHRFAFIALGADYEALGVGRAESLNPDGSPDLEWWKGWVEIMTRDPLLGRIILVYPSDSPGMQWELDRLASASKGKAIFFLVPPHVDPTAGRLTWDRARRALAARHLDIPAWDPAGVVFRHGAGGVVAEHDTFAAVWDGRLAAECERCASGGWRFHQLGIVAQARGDHAEAERQYRYAVEIDEELGDRAGMATSYHELGTLARERGDYPEAERQHRRALEIDKELGDRAGMATNYHELGTLAQDRGDHAEAERQCRRALDIEEELGDRAGMSTSYHELGILAYLQGEYVEAERQYRRALEIFEELGNRPGVAMSYHKLGILAQLQGDYPAAERQCRLALEIEEELGDRAGVATSYHELGRLARDRGDYPEAERQCRRALEIEEELGDRAGMATSHHKLGMLAQDRGDHAEAERQYRRAVEIFEELGNRAGMAATISRLGVLLTERDNTEDAVGYNVRGLTLRLAIGSPDARIDAHWLRRQQELLGDARFDELLRTQLNEASIANLKEAMFNLGLLDARFDELLRTQLNEASIANLKEAMSNLGLLLEDRGETAEAEQWYRRAAGLNDAGAMSNLGLLLEDRGETTEAEQWYRKAAALNLPQAMHNLVVLLKERGETTEAEQWYRKAAGFNLPESRS